MEPAEKNHTAATKHFNVYLEVFIKQLRQIQSSSKLITGEKLEVKTENYPQMRKAD